MPQHTRADSRGLIFRITYCIEDPDSECRSATRVPTSHYPFDPTWEWWDVVGNSQGDLVQELGEADLGEEVGEEPVEEFEEEIGEEIGEAVMRRW